MLQEEFNEAVIQKLKDHPLGFLYRDLVEEFKEISGLPYYATRVNIQSLVDQGLINIDLDNDVCYHPDYDKPSHIATPVRSAKNIAEKYKKDIVVVLTWQSDGDITYLTTYGKEHEQKIAAKRTGDKIAEALGINLGQEFENYLKGFISG